MTMSVEPGVVDANVLVCAVNSVAPQHAASRALLEAARGPAVSLYVTRRSSAKIRDLDRPRYFEA